MEKRLRGYIDDSVEDLKNQLDQLHDHFVTDSANSKVTVQFLGQSITKTEKGIKERFIELLGIVEKQLQKMQKEIHQDFEAFVAEKLYANKKRSARVAFEMDDRTPTASDTQQSSARLCSSAQSFEINFPRHQMEHGVSFVQIDKRFGIQLGNVQTHLESAVYEMKSGTYKRLADLDDRVAAMEEKLDRMILFMGKWEASNAEPNAVDEHI